MVVRTLANGSPRRLSAGQLCHCERGEAMSRGCRASAGDCFVASLLAMTLTRVRARSGIRKLIAGHHTRATHD